jgi:hypothetical protein
VGGVDWGGLWQTRGEYCSAVAVLSLHHVRPRRVEVLLGVFPVLCGACKTRMSAELRCCNHSRLPAWSFLTIASDAFTSEAVPAFIAWLTCKQPSGHTYATHTQ